MYKLASMSQQDDWTVKNQTTAKTAPTRHPKALRAHLLSTRIGETLTNNPANALSFLLILSVSAEIMLHIECKRWPKSIEFSYAEDDEPATTEVTLGEVDPTVDMAVRAGPLDAGVADL